MRESNTAPTMNVWHHVAFVFNNSDKTGTFYLDGIADGAVSGLLNTETTSAPFYIGVDAPSGVNEQSFFNGKLDDIRLYSRALTAADISSLYKSGAATRKVVSNLGLVGYWPMNEGAGTQAGDSSGNGYTGTILGNPVWADGKRGKALNFDGTGDVITATGVLSGNSAFTASAWINPADITTVWKSIFGTTCTGFDVAVHVAVHVATILFGRNCGGPDGIFYTGPTMRANEWAHIVAVFDGANIDFYKNGVKTTGGAVTYSHGATTFIGGSYSNSAELFLGKIDEVRVYNRALSADEVRQLYNMGK